ncbi:DUF177 domain-containing protein [Bradyrhizobium sp. G127]|jgi:uncharacterized metal-binding protein YceD (DUF177 family)|uniref:YceD family protein n=1 Tax=Bradyrhizobium sp. G127 TaxID=2904800 RepID=UPI001F2E3BE8|nr:DUF177 domain-containing protein [Bradyrhizobium sp. G127]MCF2523920.1 DUF177 domain-containing protein [Bradyrhizobium sp. G127]
MSKSGQMPDGDFPWSFPVVVAQLPEAGLHQVLEASAAQRQLLADAAGVNAVLRATATFDVVPEADGRVNVTGSVQARVEQACVVSLEPVENDLDESITAVFAPPAQIPVSPRSVQKEDGEDAEIPDLPEPIVNGAIDLGHLATEFLILGIDPYPRKPGVAFIPPATPQDPDEHPFAALKALKAAPGKPEGSKGKKPKGK